MNFALFIRDDLLPLDALSNRHLPGAALKDDVPQDCRIRVCPFLNLLTDRPSKKYHGCGREGGNPITLGARGLRAVPAGLRKGRIS
jgi:hypothetical protein